MTILLLITLASVILGIYKSEEPLGSCPRNAPFRIVGGNCVNFTEICIRKENSQCKSVLNACSQCPPSGYTISMLATLNEKINAITNSSNSTRTIVQLLPALNDKMNELSTLRKEIINIKNMSDSSRKQVELLPDINVTRNETLTIREEIKDLKNDGLCLKTLCILSFIEIAFIIGFCIFKILRDKNTQTKNKNGKPRSTNIQNQVFRKQSDSRKSNEAERARFIKNQPGTSIWFSNKNLEEDNRTKSESEKTPGPYDNVFGKLDETNEKLDKIIPILEKHGQDIVNSNKTLVGQNQALIRQILKTLGGQDQELNYQTPGPYDNVFGKLDETNEKLDKILKILVRRDQEMNDQIIKLENAYRKLEKIIEKLNAQKIKQITTSPVPEGVGDSDTKEGRINEDDPDDDPPSSQPITQMVSDIHH